MHVGVQARFHGLKSVELLQQLVVEFLEVFAPRRVSHAPPPRLWGWRLAARSRARRGFRATDFMLKALGTWVETNAGQGPRAEE